MKKYYPSKTALTILQVIFFSVAFIVTCVARYFLSDYPIIMWSAIILFSAAFILFGLILFPLYFSKTSYYVSKTEVAKQSGVYFESRQLMRVKSIQYITKVMAPFSKKTGFTFLKINALGGYIVILFLSQDDAHEITTTLSNSIRKSIE